MSYGKQDCDIRTEFKKKLSQISRSGVSLVELSDQTAVAALQGSGGGEGAVQGRHLNKL